MAYPTIFANLAAGNQPLALFDTMFQQVAAMVAIPCTASGTNTIALTSIGTAPTLAAYSNFNFFAFKAVATSTGSVSLNFNGLATLPAFREDASTPIGSGDIVINQHYIAMFSQSLNAGGGGFCVQKAALEVTGAASTGIFEAGGRVTLVTNTPVMTASAGGIGQHYYTPYKSQFVPIYDGTTMLMTSVGGELTQLTTDSTKSPAAVAASSVYYLFVWNDAGTFRCTRGPAWTNDTTPGAGNALTRQNGVLLNSTSITNGPSASRGTLVGAVKSNGSSLLDWTFGTLAANGGAAVLNVSNVYNRIAVETFVQDTTNNWTYTTQTWRAANNSETMRVSFLQALQQDGFSAGHIGYSSQSTTGVTRAIGIGYDSTAALAAGCSPSSIDTTNMASHASLFCAPNDIGAHFVSAIEISQAAGTTTWIGDNNSPGVFNQNGLFYRGFH